MHLLSKLRDWAQWEPEAHLVGCADLLAEFKAELLKIQRESKEALRKSKQVRLRALLLGLANSILLRATYRTSLKRVALRVKRELISQCTTWFDHIVVILQQEGAEGEGRR